MNGDTHPAARCVTCGALLAFDATICAGCGTLVASMPPATPIASSTPTLPTAVVAIATDEVPAAAVPAMSTTADDTPADVDVSAAVPEPLPDDANARLCEWCGARNPLDTERCTSCGAVFARAEQDALLQRAFQEKMALAEQDEQRRQRKRGLWGLF